MGTGVSGTPVRGILTITYNGSLIPPSSSGTYAVAANFTSASQNYGNALGTGTLTITRGRRDVATWASGVSAER